ncbi:MAG: hypothetical protein ACRETB_03355 [Steroidobacteraceae bacterium]
MKPAKWEVVAVAADTVSAGVLMGRLAAEGVRARMDADTAILGEARQCRIEVPPEAVRKARFVLWETQFSEEELASLALGEDGEPPQER